MNIPLLFKVTIITGALAAAALVKIAFYGKNDNAVEQFAEAVIQQETGFDIDLTPSTK